MSFEIVEKFENEIAKYFGSKYAIATDSCTHAIELCLRHLDSKEIVCPKRTYISVPFLSKKLGISLKWSNEVWKDYYFLTDRIADAAVLWKKDSYLPGKLMCLSFQYQKHLSLGRGGAILVDNYEEYQKLKKMSYDGRLPNIPWREQDIDVFGCHYYMTPETAQLGLEKLQEAKNKQPRQWKYTDWPDLTKMKIFGENK